MRINVLLSKKSISILLGAAFFLALALIVYYYWKRDCSGCYEIETKHFNYVIYNDLPKSIVSNIDRKLEENRSDLLNYFNLNSMNNVTVRIWGDKENYLSEQEIETGGRYRWSAGYVTNKRGASPGELRLLGSTKDLPSVALHEFVHLVTLEVNPKFANDPRWLWESIAIYKSEQQWKYAGNPGLIRSRFDAVAQSLFAGDTLAIYEIGFTIGEFIEKKWGKKGLIALINSNGNFNVVSEKSTEQIFLEWKEFVYERYFRGAEELPNKLLQPTFFP